MEDPDIVGRSSDGTGQQMGDLLLQDCVGRQADGIDVTFGFQELVDLWLGEGSIGPEIGSIGVNTLLYTYKVKC